MASGPLSGLRVIEMTGDDARLAGKMLTEAGAAVVRLGPAFGGPAMADPAVAARGGLLDWWFDGGKDVVIDDLATDAGQSAYRRLAEHADLVIESAPPGRLAELGLDHDALIFTGKERNCDDWHVSLIIGQRFNAGKNRCEYLVRNS